MITLFIDTHLFDIRMYIFKDNELLKEEKVVNKQYNSMFLIPTLKKLLTGIERYDQIIVCNGPGSFTSVRLGVTIAKTLAYTLNIPIKALSYFDMMAFSLNNRTHILGISDNNGYFIAKYRNHKKVGEYFYVNNKDFNKLDYVDDIETDVTLKFDNILTLAKDIETVNPHSVVPVYVKPIGVENDTSVSEE